MDWDAFVELAFDELRQAGAASPQVSRRLVAALGDLRRVALPDRVPAVERQLRLLAVNVHRAAEQQNIDDEQFALQGDAQGLGPAAGRTRRAS